MRDLARSRVLQEFLIRVHSNNVSSASGEL
jgi:hypothetical protein